MEEPSFHAFRKVRNRLFGLTKMKSFASYSVRKTLADGLFNSSLVYCLPLFGGLDTGDLKDLQVMQNKAAREVTLSPTRAERMAMYNRLGWLTVIPCWLFSRSEAAKSLTTWRTFGPMTAEMRGS